ncbi:MAG: CopG family antitoxin [Blastocatellia bacterium]
MPNAKSKTKAARKRDPLPEHFASLEEAAEFWDTHDSADYEEFMRDVECKVDLKSRQYLISLDGDLFRKVSSIAQAKGISSETLVNLWVQEKAV